MTVTVPRAASLIPALVLTLALGGCSLVGSMRPVSPEVTAPDTTIAPAGPEAPAPGAAPADGGAPRRITKNPPVAARPATPAAPDSAAGAAPDPTPTVTIRLSAEERAAREAQYRENLDRAVRALTSLQGRALGRSDQEELSAANQFLADARRAFEAADLSRACTVAEKARVLAEELRARLTPP